MTAAQESLCCKLYKGYDTFREVMSLKTFLRENERISDCDNTGEIKAMIATQNEKLDHECKRLVEIRSKIDKCISTIGESDLRAYMTMKYLGHMSNQDISDQMYWSKRTCERKHIKALDAIIAYGADKILDY